MASLSFATLAGAPASSGMKCRMLTSRTATGLVKSITRRTSGAPRISSGRAGADVEELRDSGVRAEAHGASEEPAVLASEPRELRNGERRPLGGFPVGREGVLAAA